MTYGQALIWAIRLLKKTSHSPELDAELILSSTDECSRATLLTRVNNQLNFWKFIKFKKYIYQRLSGYPVAYITGKKEFYGREFFVNTHTLIPRPETEILVEEAILLINSNKEIKKLIDVGTGSGCIAISLACKLPQIKILATDISKSALRIAHQNAIRFGVDNKIVLRHGNLLEPIMEQLQPNSVIIANLPYLKTEEINESLKYEPTQALDGGFDGMKFYKALLSQIKKPLPKLKPLFILLEVHPPTILLLKSLISKYLPSNQTEIIADLSGKQRLLKIGLN